MSSSLAERGQDRPVTRCLAAVLVAIACVAPPIRATAQARWDSLAAAYPPEPRAAAVPFGPGERWVYKVKLGIIPAGEASLQLDSLGSVGGHRTYHAVMRIDGGRLGFGMHDRHESWFDVRTLVSWRFLQDIHDTGYSSFRDYLMFPERDTWERQDNDESGPLGSPLPLDDVSFIYYIRTLPLEVGKTYTLTRYFKESGNPVVVRVVRRDRRKTDLGTFNTIVVKPVIRTRGFFSEGGKAELHFTDDARRILVYMKTDMPKVPGSVSLHLKRLEEGLPLNPRARADSGVTGGYLDAGRGGAA